MEEEYDVAVVGVGHIGSYLCSLLARMPKIRRITLVDPDVYKPSNVSQNIDQSQWREMLVQAPLRKGGGLFDKLLGR